jgi:small subunit ribosomal protein S18
MPHIPKIFFLQNKEPFHELSTIMSQTTNESPIKKSLSPGEYTYLDTHLLQQYVTETGKILPRRITKLSAKHQRHITRVIKQGRNLLTMK